MQPTKSVWAMSEIWNVCEVVVDPFGVEMNPAMKINVAYGVHLNTQTAQQSHGQ